MTIGIYNPARDLLALKPGSTVGSPYEAIPSAEFELRGESQNDEPEIISTHTAAQQIMRVYGDPFRGIPADDGSRMAYRGVAGVPERASRQYPVVLAPRRR